MSIVATVCLCSLGCSGKPGRLAAPEIPSDAGEQAVAKYDADTDGAISGGELDKVPALKTTLKRVDQNGDGKVTAEEINGRIAVWKKSGTALTRVAVAVTRNGGPVAGAVVKLAPESFLGPAVKAAQATTDGNGTGHLQISADPDESGVHLGYYRVQVTKAGADGKEQLPARFNVATELGAEVTRDDPLSDQLNLNLSGK